MKAKTQKTNLLREAAEWRLISLMFECPVGDWQQNVKNLADETDEAQLKTAAEFAKVEASEGLYHSIFGPGGPAPARDYRHFIKRFRINRIYKNRPTISPWKQVLWLI